MGETIHYNDYGVLPCGSDPNNVKVSQDENKVTCEVCKGWIKQWLPS